MHDTVGNFYVCEYCGKSAGEVGADAYNNYVQELPANQIDSSGRMSLIIDGWHDYYDGGEYSQLSESSSSTTSCTYTVTQSIGYYNGNHAYTARNHSVLSREFSVPVDGSYSLTVPRIDALESCDSGYLYVKYKSAGTWLEEKKDRFGRYNGSFNGISTVYSPEKQISIALYANQTYRLEVDLPTDCWSNSSPGKQLWCKASGYYKLVLFQSYSPSTYPQLSLDYRPTSISAPVYYTDNSGQVNVTTGDVHLFSENDMTLTNPQTNTTTPVTEWSFDYTTRTYDLTLDNGDHSTVTYGDKNITVKMGDNTYTYNYYIQNTNDNPGNSDNPDDPGNTETPTTDDHRHNWVLNEDSTIWHDADGNQIPPEFLEYTCSKCGLICRCHDGESPPEFGCGGGSGGGLVDPGTGELIPTGDTETGLALLRDKLLSLWNNLSESFGQLPQFYAAAAPIIPPEILQLMEWAVVVGLLVGVWRLFKR